MWRKLLLMTVGSLLLIGSYFLVVPDDARLRVDMTIDPENGIQLSTEQEQFNINLIIKVKGYYGGDCTRGNERATQKRDNQKYVIRISADPVPPLTICAGALVKQNFTFVIDHVPPGPYTVVVNGTEKQITIPLIMPPQ